MKVILAIHSVILAALVWFRIRDEKRWAKWRKPVKITLGGSLEALERAIRGTSEAAEP